MPCGRDRRLPRARRCLDPERPVYRRHTPARPHAGQSAPHRRALMGYAVSRAHHADVGGMTPGSMPAGSRELFQEGLVLPPVRLVAAGVAARGHRCGHPGQLAHAAERAGDLRAQIAAHRLADARMARARRPLGPGARRRRVCASCSPTPSGGPAPSSPASPTAPTVPRSGSRATGSRRIPSHIRVAVTVSGIG